MELSTFGAILKFAMDQEKGMADAARNLAGDLAGSGEAAPLRELTDRIAAESKRAVDLLERTRRQGVNEVVLHAVTGIDSDTYRIEGLPAGGLSTGNVGEYLASVLERAAAFYGDAGPKITNPEAARIFKRLGAQRLKLRDDIKEYLSASG
jgi:hypothetical protein